MRRLSWVYAREATDRDDLLQEIALPVVVQAAQAWEAGERTAAVVLLVVVSALYVGLAYVNERLAVRLLQD